MDENKIFNAMKANLDRLFEIAKIFERNGATDVKHVIKEFLLNAFLFDDKDNNDGIWLDLYKPFGNGNIIGDVREIIFDRYENEDEATDKLEKEYCECIYRTLPHWIKTIALSKIEDFGNA